MGMVRSVMRPLKPLTRRVVGAGVSHLEHQLGGRERTRVVLVLAAVFGLSSADFATVGAAALQIRQGLDISDTQIGLLVSTTSLVGGIASLPFGWLADHVRRTLVLGLTVGLWAVAMLASAVISTFPQLLLTRMGLGAATAAAGPFVASLVGDYFGADERGKIYGYILAGELVGAGVGFAVAGDIAALSWRASFVVLAIPAAALAVAVVRLPEPDRGTTPSLPSERHDVQGGEESTDEVREMALREHGDDVVARPPRHGVGGLIDAWRFILSVRTNLLLIAASAAGYYFLAGAETFGVVFVRKQYGVGLAVANPLLLIVGIGAIAGVLVGGALADMLIRHGVLTARILVSAGAGLLAAIAFIPAVITRSPTSGVLLLMAASFALAAQNPPLDAARLDIMPSELWGQAESIRTLLRTLAQAAAPLAFGAVSDYVFGGGRVGLERAFLLMLLPLLASSYIIFRARRTYPADVAAAAVHDAPS
jgi:predicted MFS family arabinose efflux permease